MAGVDAGFASLVLRVNRFVHFFEKRKEGVK